MMMEDDEREHWLQYGRTTFAEFMQRVEKMDRMGMKGMKESKNRVTLIDKRKVYATLDEVADLYVNEEKKLVLDFTESKAMIVLKSPSPDYPMDYCGMRWSYYKSPSRIVKDQDFFYIETMKPFVDVYGRRGWAKCSHSIEHPMCPDDSTSRGVNRGQLYYSGVVYMETRQKGVLETTFYYSIDTTSIPAFLLPVVMKARGKNNAALINHYVKVARISAYADRRNVKKLRQQLMEERRCGACSNHMPKWFGNAKCVFCKSYVCKRCCDIIAKNYLFDGSSCPNSCMLCAEKNGTKIASLMDESEGSSATDDSATPEDEIPSSTTASDSTTNSQVSLYLYEPDSLRTERSKSSSIEVGVRIPNMARRTSGGTSRQVRSMTRSHVDRYGAAAQPRRSTGSHSHGAADTPAAQAKLCDLSYLSAFKV